MMPAAVFPVEADRTSWLARLHPATRVALSLLVMATLVVGPVHLIPVFLLATFWLLRRGGFGLPAAMAILRPWLPVVLLVLVVHTLTTTDAAPLFRPSWLGLFRGFVAVARVLAVVLVLILFMRVTGVGDLIEGLRWWCRPLDRIGFDAARWSLAVTVALGTAPSVLAEGRRIEKVVRLRRGPAAGKGRGLRGLWRAVLDRGHLIVPLTEGLLRRAEGLSLSLQHRLPVATAPVVRPPGRQLAATAAWAALLVIWPWL